MGISGFWPSQDRCCLRVADCSVLFFLLFFFLFTCLHCDTYALTKWEAAENFHIRSTLRPPSLMSCCLHVTNYSCIFPRVKFAKSCVKYKKKKGRHKEAKTEINKKCFKGGTKEEKFKTSQKVRVWSPIILFATVFRDWVAEVWQQPSVQWCLCC